MHPDEIIYGKNAVLAYLEHAGGEFAPDQRDQPEEDEVREALAKLHSEASGKSSAKVDLAALSRMSKTRITKILLAAGTKFDARIERIQELARQQKIPVQSCQRLKLDQLTGPNCGHQGVVALVSPAEMWTLETFLHRMQLDQLKRQLSGRSMNGYM
ncbi:MAG: hypothetical protein HY711_01465, partial [Candidatus Melainabacteria bacterium]|nr:hypothetical protein [Candidatus Melainabacteria bacterium]